MTDNLVGAIDEGTSSARFMVFKAGTDEVVATHQLEVPSIYPQEGWVEQDPMLILHTVETCIKECVKKVEQLGSTAKNIVAIGVTNQRESVVVWDRKTGKPLYNAIIWLDNRTTSTVDELVKTIPGNLKDKNYLAPLCGLPLSPYFSALKLRWLRDNVAHVQKALEEETCMVGTIDSWLIYNLTGGASNGGIHVTDVTNASRTMLMHIESLEWDDRLLRFFGLPKTVLPNIRSSAEEYGLMKSGPLKGVPLCACLGDQQAALVGQQCLKRGQCKSTYGTGCFLLYNTGKSIVFSKQGLLTTVGYKIGNEPVEYALEGSVAIAGAAFTWLRDNLGLFDAYGQIEEMARMVDNSLDVYFVPAFSGLYAPYWNQEARGVICGLSEQTTSEHIVRATLESVCFQVRDIIEAMRKDCGIPLDRLMVDGGMTMNQLFVQLQADLVGITVIRANISETTALGVALAAYKVVCPSFDMQAPLSATTPLNIYKPKAPNQDRDVRYRKWKMAVERAFDWDRPPVPDSALF